MAATTTMHLGPEWMRAKAQSCPTRQQAPPSPPPQALLASHQLGASTYSALVTPLTQEPVRRDESRPFRYTKDELLRIYREGGGRGGLNLEVERWEGIVRDVANEPAALREMTEAEKKLFAGPLNSELRRRQSTDLMNTHTPSDRQRLVHSNSAANAPLRYGPFSARRRDSTDQPPLALPRKLSLSTSQSVTLTSPRDALPSPRNRIGALGSGFDGVLNNGDSWSRRRPSVGVAGAGGGVIVRGDGKEEDARHSEIKEEEESAGHHLSSAHDSDPAAVTDLSSPGLDVPTSDPTPDGQVTSQEFDSARQSIARLSLEAQNQPNSNPQVLSSINPFLSGPPGLTDPASVEWSYLDPQGRVQGPFRADLMQKWFDEGYFTPDLLMKRTQIDADWIAVGILERRAAGGKIFLTQISNGPPGLVIRTDSPRSHSPVHEQTVFNGYQSAPTQSLRTTLDSSLNGSSPVESPSSSFGGGRFGNGSPDPSVFGGRPGTNVYSSDSNFGGRTFAGRTVFQEPISDARTFSNNFLGRVPTIDTLNTFNGGGDTSPWSAGPGQINQGFNNDEQHPYSNGFNGMGSGTIGNSLSVNHVHGIDQEHFGDAAYGSIGSYDSSVALQPSDADGISFNSNMVDGLGSQFNAPTGITQPPSLPFATPQHRQSISPYGDLLLHSADGFNATQTPTSAVQPNNASPWTTLSRSFESPVVPSPVAPPARPQTSEWVAPQLAQSVDPSPWLIASLPVADDVWREAPGPNSLTFSNLGQHNRLQQQDGEETDDIAMSPVDDVPLPSHTPSVQAQSTNVVTTSATTMVSQSVFPEITSAPTPDIPDPIVPKARRKSTTREAQAPASKTAPASILAVAKDNLLISSPPASQSKPVWAIDDDSKKQKGTGTTISLREIQEAEERKAEARKVAEKERERLARANATAGNAAFEEGQPFTSSWGLPTSQVGVRNQILPKETGTASSAPLTTPVWTNATPPPTAKKTMKEIQEEEEERRKKIAVKESMASAAARRVYAETTLKVVPGAPAAGGPWTTVGPNGKPTPATNIARAPANASPNSPSPTTTPRTNGTANRHVAASPVKVKAPRAEEFSAAPSHDFLKWLGESLKGLNSSVNLEEITSMLLSFPLDPDQSTLEIISDLIYANSTTLDGRRFASEYVSRRKADAATRRGSTGVLGSSSKPVSIADVVKTQPKPVQQEWGFKVVNKKKKGGRS